MFDNRIVFHAHFCESIRAVLAHSDAVSPGASGEIVAGCSTVCVVAFVDDEKLFVKAESRANFAAF